MAGRHDWNSWDNYQTVHQRCLKDFEHFILHDDLSPVLTSTRVHWDGVLYCLDGIEVHVRKDQIVARMHGGRIMVRTVWYSYHVLRRTGASGHQLVPLR